MSEFQTVEVDLNPDHDPESIGVEYRAIVMTHNGNGESYNGGIVVRASSPEKAFSLALEQWRKK